MKVLISQHSPLKTLAKSAMCAFDEAEEHLLAELAAGRLVHRGGCDDHHLGLQCLQPVYQGAQVLLVLRYRHMLARTAVTTPRISDFICFVRQQPRQYSMASRVSFGSSVK